VSRQFTQEYEALRTAVLDGGLSFDARNGLALFLRRGMWGWARAKEAPGDAPKPMQPASSQTTTDDTRRAVIQLFAAIATSSTKRRPHERVS
jgi:hypothetical protein